YNLYNWTCDHNVNPSATTMRRTTMDHNAFSLRDHNAFLYKSIGDHTSFSYVSCSYPVRPIPILLPHMYNYLPRCLLKPILSISYPKNAILTNIRYPNSILTKFYPNKFSPILILS